MFKINLKYYIVNLKRFWQLISKFKDKIFKAGIFLMVSVLLELPLPLVTKYLIDDVFITNKFNLLFVIILSLFGVHILKTFSSYMQARYLIYFKEQAILEINSLLFKHVQELPLTFFHSTQTSYLAARIRDDTWAIQSLLGDTILNVLRDVFTFLVGIVVIFFLHWKLALVSLVIFPFFVLSLTVFNKKIRNYQKIYQEKSAVTTKDFQESFGGIFYIKTFLQEKFQHNKIIASLDEVKEASIKSSFLQIKADTINLLIAALGPLTVLGYGGYEVMNNNLSLGGLVAFSSFLGYMYGPARRFLYINTTVQRGLASLERIYELLEIKPEANISNEPVEVPYQPPVIKFENVSFSYDGEKDVLKDINFDVENGKITALVGPSGVGKTTLVNLIPRFFEPRNGTLLINNRDIACSDLKSVRRLVGIVGQEPFMFDDTILENIGFGNKNSSEAEIYEAAKLANAHNFISNLPEKYQTRVGERGVKLSVGEKQRIGVARCLLKKPLILILDEPTSSIDSKSEQLILETIKKIKKGKIVLVIAHRLSTILAADEIVVMKDGEIIETGTHRELLDKGDFYTQLFNNQFNV